MAAHLKRCMLAVVLLLLVLPLFAAQKETNRNVRFGLPTSAKTDSAQRDGVT